MDSRMKTRLSALSVTIMLAACSPKSVDDLVADAQRFAQSGQKDAAIIELKNAVAQQPNSHAVRTLLGKLYFETGQLDAADKERPTTTGAGSNSRQCTACCSRMWTGS